MERKEHVKLFFAGDTMTGRGIDQIMPYPNEPELQESFVRDARQYVALAEQHSGRIPHPVDFSYVWGDALNVLTQERPDLRIVNLETAVTNSGDFWPDKGIHYRMHPRNAVCLSGLGVQCCTLANNHLLDWGYAGLEETRQVLRDHKIAACGAGDNLEQAAAPAVLGIPSLLPEVKRLLVFSFGMPSSGIPYEWAATADKPGVYLLPDLSAVSVSTAVEQIERFREPGDLVMASVHWGVNWGYQIANEQRRFARGLVDAGVDVVHGHSSHHPIGMELYRQRLICYGCGDFVNDYEGIRGHEAYRAHVSLMFLLILDLQGRARALKIVPMQMKQLRLQYASDDDAAWITRVLQKESGDYGLRLGLTEPASRAHMGPHFWIDAAGLSG